MSSQLRSELQSFINFLRACLYRWLPSLPRNGASMLFGTPSLRCSESVPKSVCFTAETEKFNLPFHAAYTAQLKSGAKVNRILVMHLKRDVSLDIVALAKNSESKSISFHAQSEWRWSHHGGQQTTKRGGVSDPVSREGLSFTNFDRNRLIPPAGREIGIYI